jgi:hypothetical protein
MNKFDWIRSQLLPNETPGGAVVRLNFRHLVPNPTPQGDIPAPVTISDLVNLCDDDEEFAITETQTYKLAVEAWNSGNRTDAINYFHILIRGGVIGEASAQAIGARLQETIPDPNWEPQVMLSLAEQAGHGFVSYEEIAEAIANT